MYAQNPQSADALRDLANAFFLNENYAAALDAMDRLAKLETPKPGSWFVRAICYDKLSRKAEAIEAYQKFLDQDNGQHDTQDFQARHRMLVLQRELGTVQEKVEAMDEIFSPSRMTVPVKIRIAVIAALALCARARRARPPGGRVLREYQHETDPVRKARALAKLGDEQVDLAKKQLKDGDEVASLHTLEQYRDEVQQTVAALKALGVDAEKKPAGFKELQISLRETIRRIDESDSYAARGQAPVFPRSSQRSGRRIRTS